MQIRTQFEVNQFIQYLKEFNLSVLSIQRSKDVLQIYCNDNSKYLMTQSIWESIQKIIPRLNNEKVH